MNWKQMKIIKGKKNLCIFPGFLVVTRKKLTKVFSQPITFSTEMISDTEIVDKNKRSDIPDTTYNQHQRQNNPSCH
jgi:hypothetical protein